MVVLIVVLISVVVAQKTPQYLYPMDNFTDIELGDVEYIDFWSCQGQISFLQELENCEYKVRISDTVPNKSLFTFASGSHYTERYYNYGERVTDYYDGPSCSQFKQDSLTDEQWADIGRCSSIGQIISSKTIKSQQKREQETLKDLISESNDLLEAYMSEMEMLETNTKRIKTRLEVFKKQWYASGFKSTETQDATFETLADNIQTLQEQLNQYQAKKIIYDANQLEDLKEQIDALRNKINYLFEALLREEKVKTYILHETMKKRSILIFATVIVILLLVPPMVFLIVKRRRQGPPENQNHQPVGQPNLVAIQANVQEPPKVAVGLPLTGNEPIETSQIYFGQDVMVATPRID